MACVPIFTEPAAEAVENQASHDLSDLVIRSNGYGRRRWILGLPACFPVWLDPSYRQTETDDVCSEIGYL